MPGVGGQRSYLPHYAAGKVSVASLPVSATKINIDAIARVPGTTTMLAGGYPHASGNQGSGVISVPLRYGS